MKKIDKTHLIIMCITKNCSEDELMKKLEVFKCKRNYTDFYHHKLKKDELYYVIMKNSNCIVLNKSSLMQFSIDKSINCEYFYDYFMTAHEMRKEKLIKIQQVSNRNLLD